MRIKILWFIVLSALFLGSVGGRPALAQTGIPSRMQVKESVPVAVTLRNTGSREWSSTSDSPVRLVVRWVNSDTKSRSNWAVKWLSKVAKPGESVRVDFDLVAPSRPGKYVLSYALVRLNPDVYDGKNYKPPVASATDQRWPGEFGTVSFEIDVVS